MGFLSLFTFLLATVPLFFEIYRTAAFNTIPRDDYAPYLLHLLGQGGEIPGAPFAYRVLSIAVAIPFYYLLPPYAFTNLPNVDAAYLRATEALSFLSYLSILLTGLVIYKIARHQFGASPASSAMVGWISLLLCNFVSTVGVDPFAILVISLLLLTLNDARLFAPLVLLSVGINEKIVCLMATVLFARAVAGRLQHRPFPFRAQLLAAWTAMATYVVFRCLFKVSGGEEQTDPSFFLVHLRSTLALVLSPKGLVLCVLPVLLLTFLFLIARRSREFPAADVSGLLILLGMALVADVEYNVGRVAMYSYPLYLPAAAGFIDNVLRPRSSPTRLFHQT